MAVLLWFHLGFCVIPVVFIWGRHGVLVFWGVGLAGACVSVGRDGGGGTLVSSL